MICTAWLAVLSDRWECERCQREADYTCARDETSSPDLLARATEAQTGKEPLIFAGDRMGICPRCLVTSWSAYMWQAYQWREAGGDLGISFADAPGWLIESFNILAGAYSEAMRYKYASDSN